MPNTIEEEILEMILIRSKEDKPTGISDLDPLHNGNIASNDDIQQLLIGNFVFYDSAGNLNLTTKGEETAGRVLKKHQILEVFFSQVLGLDKSAASDEACKLEHSVDDFGISRLEGLVAGDGISIVNDSESRISLAQCNEGSKVRIAGIKEHGNDRLLHDLGFCPGEVVLIKRKLHNSSLIIEVKGCEIAVSRDVAGDVTVMEYK